MQAELITTHIEDGLNRFIQQYKNSDKLKGICGSFCKQIQDLENAFNGLYGRLDIANVEGKLLDDIGIIVGQDRLGFDDEIYRILLITRITINTSGGTPRNIIDIFKQLIQATEVDYREIYPASVQISCDVEPPTEYLNYIKIAIDTALPAGVNLSFIGYYDPAVAFTMDDGLGEIDALHGFGDIYNPSTGGELGKIL